MTEFLIVGDGLAGINLAWHLYRKNLDFKIVSDQGPRSSTVAAGIINPVIGRKFNLSWRFDEIYQCLQSQYSGLPFEEVLIKMPILRSLNTVFDLNEYSLRENELLNGDFVSQNGEEYHSRIEAYNLPAMQWIEILKAGRLDTAKFIHHSIDLFTRKGMYVNDHIGEDQIRINGDQIEITFFKSKYVLFAEGMPMPMRSVINQLPLVPQKGEVLIFESESLPEDIIVKHKYFVVPLGKKKFWLGSNYDWHTEEYMLPMEEQYSSMRDFLLKIGQSESSILVHRMGYRPTIKDRMPIVGQVKPWSNAFVLNGMGSKGASLAPYCAQLLVDHILEGLEIPRDVNISRFEKSHSK